MTKDPLSLVEKLTRWISSEGVCTHDSNIQPFESRETVTKLRETLQGALLGVSGNMSVISQAGRKANAHPEFVEYSDLSIDLADHEHVEAV